MKRTRMARIRSLRWDEPLPEGEPKRYKDGRGYVRLRWLVGPQSYVETWEHRVVMGRPHPRYQVHHINGIKDDNRPENLQLLTIDEHARLHQQQAREADPLRGQRFGGYRCAEAQAKAERRKAREAEYAARAKEMGRLYEQGLTTIEIGHLFGIHASNVSRHLRSIGVLTRTGSGKARDALYASKQAVRVRSHLRCERCGVSTKWNGGGDVHHRVPRGAGGTSVEWVNLPANLLNLCRDCHGYIESHRTEAYNEGWLLRRPQVPWEVPVLTHRGYLLLDNDGGFEVCPEEWHKPFRDGHYDERPT